VLAARRTGGRGGRRLGIEDVSTDWERFVGRPDLDIISACTPTDLHREQVLAAVPASLSLSRSAGSAAATTGRIRSPPSGPVS
jgi:hypothetical protein